MRIVVMSDSHGRADSVAALLNRHRDGADLFIHLGDGLEDVPPPGKRTPRTELLLLRGNCDMFFEAPEALLYPVLAHGYETRLLCCHGHQYGVKGGLSRLVAEGERRGANAALFGHTHQPLCERKDALWLINPGSLRFGGTYAVIDLLESGPLFHIARLYPIATQKPITATV